ncbi:MAG: glycosyltransferase family 9 protein [Candidatus Goldiibacteriota bacterium]
MNKFLVCRTDGVGDLLLTTPLIRALSKTGAEVSVLCSSYAAPVLENNPDAAGVFIYDPADPFKELDAVKAAGFDAAFVVYPRRQAAALVKKAGIPLRFGTAGRWYSYFYFNRPVRISRKKNEKHEAAYNLDIAAPVIGEGSPAETFFYLSEAEKKFGEDYARSFGGDFIIVYPGGKRTSEKPDAAKYARIIDETAEKYKGKIVLIPGINEKKTAEAVYEKSRRKDKLIVDDKVLSLRQLAGVISRADVFVSGSTGPMHIAAALNVPVAAFFPRDEGMLRRWAPLGKNCTVIRPENDEGINAEAAADVIIKTTEKS